MEDEQASIQPTWPKTISPQGSRGAGASTSTCCTISGTVLQEGVERREMVWTGSDDDQRVQKTVGRTTQKCYLILKPLSVKK